MSNFNNLYIPRNISYSAWQDPYASAPRPYKPTYPQPAAPGQRFKRIIKPIYQEPEYSSEEEDEEEEGEKPAESAPAESGIDPTELLLNRSGLIVF